jgi:polysaccharide pyruvyl transferase WcaK-like protein
VDGGPDNESGTATRLSTVEATPTGARFEVTIGDRAHEIWFEGGNQLAAANEAAAVATLIPALAVGEPLRLEVPVAHSVIDAMNEAQGVLCSWGRSGAWLPASIFTEPIEISAPERDPDPVRPARGTAAFFSGGVDSLATVLRHPEITHLIYVEGFDIGLERTALSELVRSRVQAAAADLGKELLTLRTNLRELTDPHAPWPVCFGGALGVVALLLSEEVGRVMIGSSSSYEEDLLELGSHPLLDHLWGADRVEVIHDGATLSRLEKLELIAEAPTARGVLKVCWENQGGAYNCGRCEKCLRTMVPLALLGVLDRFPTLPGSIDLEAVAAVQPGNRPEIVFWSENLELAARTRAAPELVTAIEDCLANGRAGQAGQRDPVRPPSVADPRIGRLYMRPADARVLAGARGAAILIGGYEGWGNYGDLAQLEATLDLLGSAAAGVVGCPVISLHTAREHAERRAAGEFSDHVELYYTPPGEESDPLAAQLGLVPAVLPGPIKAVVWLYGGGYLNPAWGVWKLRILEAVRSLLRRMGQTEQVLISSGLQIDPGWSGQLSAALRAALTGLDPLGVRDELSAQAAPILLDSTATALRTGDDALGVLKHADPPDPGLRGGEWRLNLHFCPGEWVADDPAAARAWLRDLVAEIARLTGERIRVQPLIAYEDPSLSERADLATLCAELESQSGITSAEPIVLTASAILDHAATVGSARLSVSTSYHVALTSLLLGVPAVLVQETAYYAQKASGLRADFKLPDAAFPDLTEAPDRAASQALAGLGLLGQSTDLDLGAARVRALSRREAAEAELTVRLSQAFEGAEPRRSTRLVSLTARERDELLGALEQAEARLEALAAESEALSAQAAWSEARLADITASSSWRLTTPIRRAKGILRQARSRGRG